MEHRYMKAPFPHSGRVRAGMWRMVVLNHFFQVKLRTAGVADGGRIGPIGRGFGEFVPKRL